MSWIKLDIKANEEKVYWNRRPKNFFNIPEVSCCYAIYFNDELVYIGSTNNLSNRVSQYKFKHMGNEIKTHWGYVDKNTKINIKYKTSKKYGYWLMLEARLIKKLQPKFNIKLKNGTHL